MTAPRVGLRLYLAFAFAIFAIVIGAAFGTIAGRAVFATLEQRVGAVLARGVGEALAAVDHELRERQDDLAGFATMMGHAGAFDVADLERIGVDALVRQPPREFGCDWAAGVSLRGEVATASAAGPARGTKFDDQDWFAKAGQGEIVAARTEHDPDGRPYPSVTLARPLLDRDRQPFAIVVCALGKDWANGLVERVGQGLPGALYSSDIVVIDAASQPVMASRRVASQSVPPELLRPDAPANGGWMQVTWANEGDFVASVASPGSGPVAQLGWRAIVRRLAIDAMEPAAAMRDRVYIFSAVVALAAAALGFVAASRIVVPLRRIADSARRIGDGELGVHIPEFAGYREIATLSESLRSMLAALRANEARLAALNENLDQRVRQRTSEIAEAHDLLARQERRLRAVIDTAIDGVLIVGEGNRVETFNPACEAIFGWKADEIIGHSVSELIGGDARTRRGGPHGFDELIASLLEAGETRGHVRTVRGRRRDGGGFPLEVSLSRTLIQNVPVHIAIVRDVTEAVRAHDELFAMATKDALTSLRNRRYFLEGAETEFARARRHGRGFSLMLIDADHFKKVNDTFGHDAGDRVLQTIADVALGSLRELDLVGRLGGEEFAVAMPEVDLATALAVAERLRLQIAERTMDTDGGAVSITVSIGVAAISPEDETLNQMLRRADQALYAAKNRGRNQVFVAGA